MKVVRYTAVIAFVLCSCNEREDSASVRESTGTVKEVAPAAIAREEELVKLNELLPVKVMYQSMGRGGNGNVLQISGDKIELQRFKDGGLVTIAAMPARLQELEAALQGVSKDYFRGTVYYSNPHVRDGGKRRMITSLGDISEYGVFGWGPKEDEKWPQAILALKPLFDLYDRWAMELEKPEVPRGKPAEQATPSDGDKPPD